MKILTIVGARPQFIKAAAVSREIAKHSTINEVIVHTGQHFDKNMSEVFFEEMNIPKPHYNLNINSLGHGAMTGRMLEGIEGILLNEKPDWVLVYGDTNSTLAGALAASKLHIKIAHVEAGLRSFNTAMPEEINRILTDRISNALFCPTEQAVKNLESEGFNKLACKIVNIGDVMQDAAMFYAKHSKKPELDLSNEFVLATVHRAENTNDRNRLSSIVEALNEIHKKTTVLLPLHPRTRRYIEEYSLHPQFNIIEPVGYLEMVYLLQNCSMVMTDSGGLQKEAYFFKKPCLTLRDETEWVELIKNNVNILCNTMEKESIIEGYYKMYRSKIDFDLDLYGDGNAGGKLLENLKKI